MKKLFTLATALTLGAALTAPAFAWPDKPVTLVVPFPPGGASDTVARAVGQRNKAGATGTIGAALVKRAAPDGYTVLVSSLGPFVIAPHLLKNVPYDAGKDFDLPHRRRWQAPNVLVVPASLAAPQSLADVHRPR
jgi:tripartite-type tricarboxylate transporter receptor subunit TctC